jgi:hypothetical protein
MESFVVESWGQHLQQHERFTVADREVEAQVLTFHQGESTPVISHFIAERYLS